MARKPRQESSTGYYHVMLRGINREHIFRHHDDKQNFMGLVKEQQEEGLLQLAGWCVMNNHVHMMLKADIADMADALKVVNLKYASRYNSRNTRTGPVFGDRYRSECIEDDAYLLGALRYIHNNPVKAGLASDVVDYSWSSYGEYLSGLNYLHPAQKSFVLSLFDGGLTGLIDFHREDDTDEYLENREDLSHNRRRLAEKMLAQYRRDAGFPDLSQLLDAPDHMFEMSRILVHECHLPIRDAAELLGVPHNRVHLALKRQE